MVELLIQAGSNLSATDNDGNTPLHLAASAGNTTVRTNENKWNKMNLYFRQRQSSPIIDRKWK